MYVNENRTTINVHGKILMLVYVQVICITQILYNYATNTQSLTKLQYSSCESVIENVKYILQLPVGGLLS